MVRRYYGDEGFGEERLDVYRFSGISVAEDANVEVAGLQAFENAGAEGLVEVEFNVREAFAIGTKDCG